MQKGREWLRELGKERKEYMTHLFMMENWEEKTYVPQLASNIYMSLLINSLSCHWKKKKMRIRPFLPLEKNAK